MRCPTARRRTTSIRRTSRRAPFAALIERAASLWRNDALPLGRLGIAVGLIAAAVQSAAVWFTAGGSTATLPVSIIAISNGACWCVAAVFLHERLEKRPTGIGAAIARTLSIVPRQAASLVLTLLSRGSLALAGCGLAAIALTFGSSLIVHHGPRATLGPMLLVPASAWVALGLLRCTLVTFLVHASEPSGPLQALRRTRELFGANLRERAASELRLMLVVVVMLALLGALIPAVWTMNWALRHSSLALDSLSARLLVATLQAALIQGVVVPLAASMAVCFHDDLRARHDGHDLILIIEALGE